MNNDLAILMPNYNGMPFLKEAIDSIDRSTVKPNELIIVDDGSEDESLGFIRSMAEKAYAIRLICNNHGGQASALNRGLQEANTKFIMRMDADDLLLPLKIEKQMNFLYSHPEIFIVGSNAKYIDALSGTTIGKTNFLPDYRAILKRYQQGGYGLLDGTIMFRNPKRFLNCRYDEAVSVGNEVKFHLDILLKNRQKAANLHEHLYLVRIHKKSLSVSNTLTQVKAKHEIKRKYFSQPNTLLEQMLILHDFASLYCWKKALLNRANSFSKYLFYTGLTAIMQPSRVLYRLAKVLEWKKGP